MTKNEYLAKLRSCLECLDSGERETALQFYSEYFDDAGEENIQRIMDELGSPEKLAREIIAQSSEGGEKSSPHASTYTAETSFKDICTSVINARVRIELGNDYRVDIDYPEEVKKPEVSIQNGVLSIIEKPVKRSFMSFFNHQKGWRQGSIVITIPDAEFGSFKLESVNGSISVPAIKLEMLRCNAVNGSIKADGVKAASIYCENVNGSAKITDCEASSLCCGKTVNGSVIISGRIKGKISMESVNGSTRFSTEYSLNDFNCNIDTVSGSAYLNGVKQRKHLTLVNSNASSTLSASTVNGSVHADFAG